MSEIEELRSRIEKLERAVAQLTEALAAKAPRAASKTVTKAMLLDAGLRSETADDFLAHRRQIKAPLTATALKGIEREAQKARMSLESVATLMMVRGWRGFVADWAPTNKVEAAMARNRGAGDAWLNEARHG